MARRPKLTVDDAQTLGLTALAFLAEDEQRLTTFLTVTGAEPAALRDAAGEGETLRAVLDFLLSDESLLLMFTANRGLAPEDVATARHLLQPAR